MKDLVTLFTEAEALVKAKGFGKEIEWCDNRFPFHYVSASVFLREYAWVVLNSGMRNSVIRAKWKDIGIAFLDWHIRHIVNYKRKVLAQALTIFNHKEKMKSIIQVAEMLRSEGWQAIQEEIEHDPIGYLDSLPFIGKVTRYHLARNLGFDVVKPDRHLVRLAAEYDMTPFELCNEIHKQTGRRLGTIDVILWRYCEQKKQLPLASFTQKTVQLNPENCTAKAK